MKRTEIDIETWGRRCSYAFFKEFLLPVCSVSSEIDCTEAFDFCKKNKVSYSMLCCYAALRSSNEIREFRYRVENGGATVVEYDVINLCTPIKLNNSHRFASIMVPYEKDFHSFCKSMHQQMGELTEETTEFEKRESQGGILNVSCTPELYFTSIAYPDQGNGEYTIMLSNFGKVVKREGRWVMPVAIQFHHGLCDGHHVSLFLSKVEQYLKDALCI